MFTGAVIICLYIFHALRLGVNPTRYFQLNAPYFNEDKGIYSKLEMDRLIPEPWRLEQFRDDGVRVPDQFPVFVKPEWGQNARGIQRANNLHELQALRAQNKDASGGIGFLVQEGAKERHEFEIFVLPDPEDMTRFCHFSAVRVHNAEATDYPINSFYNPHTTYEEVTERLSLEDKQTIWSHLKEIQTFRMARFGLRANSLEDVMAGRFHIIEINLFFPVPLHLFSPDKTWRDRFRIGLLFSQQLAHLTKAIPTEQKHKSVFFGKYSMLKRVKGYQEEYAKVDK